MGKTSGLLGTLKRIADPLDWLLKQPVDFVLRLNRRNRRKPFLYYSIKFAVIGLVIAGILFLVFKFNQNRSNNLQMLLSNQPPSVFLETDKKSVEEMRKLTKQRVGGDPLE